MTTTADKTESILSRIFQPIRKITGYTFRDAYEEFLVHAKEVMLKPDQELKNMYSERKRTYKYFGNGYLLVKNITPTHVESYKDYIKSCTLDKGGKRLSASYVNNHIKSLNAFFYYAYTRGYIKVRFKVKNTMATNINRPIMTDTVLQQFLNHDDIKIKVASNVMFHLGVRPGALHRLKWDDFKWNDKKVWIARLNTVSKFQNGRTEIIDNGRYYPMPEEFINQVYTHSKKSGYVWKNRNQQSIRYAFRRYHVQPSDFFRKMGSNVYKQLENLPS